MCCSCLKEPKLIGSLRGLIYTIVLLEVYRPRRVKDFFKDQCPKNDRERMTMKNLCYSLVVDSMMYDQVCT